VYTPQYSTVNIGNNNSQGHLDEVESLSYEKKQTVATANLLKYSLDYLPPF